MGYLAAVLVFAALAVGTAPASAVPPARETASFEITDFPVGSCGAFNILGNAEVTLRTTTFFDGGGNPTLVEVYVERRGNFVNSITGSAVTDFGTFTIFLDFQRGTQAWIGVVFHVNVPGEGVVALDAGSIVVSLDADVGTYFAMAETIGVVFEGGPHELFNSLEPLCAALS